MDVTGKTSIHGPGLRTPERNHYFYGKLLDAYHFDLETGYFNGKRRLLNRLVSGYGVLCGLDVQLADDKQSILVLPGVALDKRGQEIIVPETSKPVALPAIGAEMTGQPPSAQSSAQSGQMCPPTRHVHVLLCYYECESDPAPVLAGDCDAVEICKPSVIRERYRIVIKDGPAPELHMECALSTAVSGNQIDYPALARWVTSSCPALPDDPCICLANVRIPDTGEYDPADIDITVRPIVYTNDLLFEIILALTCAEQSQPRGGKS
jgi:hypothetical protein